MLKNARRLATNQENDGVLEATGIIKTDKSTFFMRIATTVFVFTIILALAFFLALMQSESSGRVYTSRDDHGKNYNTLANVTRKCYFDVSFNGKPKGRIIIGLFGDDVPKTA